MKNDKLNHPELDANALADYLEESLDAKLENLYIEDAMIHLRNQANIIESCEDQLNWMNMHCTCD